MWDEQDLLTHIEHSIAEGDFEMAQLYKDPMVVGVTVEILPVDEDAPEYHGKVGTLAEINPHHDDGDFYGVVFPGREGCTYFWRKELKIIEN